VCGHGQTNDEADDEQTEVKKFHDVTFVSVAEACTGGTYLW
jgi:hypothetical protein